MTDLSGLDSLEERFLIFRRCKVTATDTNITAATTQATAEATSFEVVLGFEACVTLKEEMFAGMEENNAGGGGGERVSGKKGVVL